LAGPELLWGCHVEGSFGDERHFEAAVKPYEMRGAGRIIFSWSDQTVDRWHLQASEVDATPTPTATPDIKNGKTDQPDDVDYFRLYLNDVLLNNVSYASYKGIPLSGFRIDDCGFANLNEKGLVDLKALRRANKIIINWHDGFGQIWIRQQQLSTPVASPSAK
jgi:hypothetical protein